MSIVDDDGYATLEGLTETSELEGEDYSIMYRDGVERKVRIRPLSRAEVLKAQRLRDTGLVDMEAHMIMCAVVRPRLRDVDVREWMATTRAGTLEPLTRHINAISALGEGADSEAYERFRDEPGPGIRSLPSGETGGDTGDGPSDGQSRVD